MPARLEAFLATIRKHHVWTPPVADVEQQIAAFTDIARYALPTDIEMFYRTFSTASLCDERYKIMSLSEIPSLSDEFFNRNESWLTIEPSSGFVFCDVWDGNYVGVLLDSDEAKHGQVIDCDHDNSSEFAVVARSFTDFLECALQSGDRLFYLQDGFVPLAVLTETRVPAPEFLRQTGASFWNALGPEIGPEICVVENCMRLRIAHSGYCKPHHYEMVHHEPCPFPG